MRERERERERESYGVLRHFQHHFSHIVAVSLIGGGNRSTRRHHSFKGNDK